MFFQKAVELPKVISFCIMCLFGEINKRDMFIYCSNLERIIWIQANLNLFIVADFEFKLDMIKK